MIKWEDERTVTTIFIRETPYDTDKTYTKKFKVFGLTLWHKTFHVNASYADCTKLGDKKKPGFIQPNEKDN